MKAALLSRFTLTVHSSHSVIGHRKELLYLVRCGDGEQTTGEDDGSGVAVTEAEIEQRRSEAEHGQTRTQSG
ncbi:hypothetical protein SESBI_32041 [Sesbania bispinosa]|nr:hypothetical protein SESBI_32041 [Sesbania bispinosa]